MAGASSTLIMCMVVHKHDFEPFLSDIMSFKNASKCNEMSSLGSEKSQIFKGREGISRPHPYRKGGEGIPYLLGASF